MQIHNFLSEKGENISFPHKGILGQTAEAKGKRFNATIGIAAFDDRTPMHIKSIKELVSLSPDEIFPYSPSFGVKELRELWKEKIKEKNPSLKSEISMPVVANGLTHALSVAGYLFVNPGDEIILTDKYWGNYNQIFSKVYGAELKTFNTFKKNGFDIESFEDAVKSSNSDKKIILFNFPNNPTGYTPTEKEAEKIAGIIKKLAEKGSRIITIIDDAYFGLVYKKGIFKESIFSKLAGLHENILAVKIDGASKELYAWGLRVGFITFGIKNGSIESYKQLEDKSAGVIRATISNASNLSQNLILKALKSESYNQEKKKNYDILKQRFDKVESALKNKKYSEFFTPLPFNSGYFMCVELKNSDGEIVRRKLLKEYDTGVIASGNLLRIAFSSVPLNQIETLFENIYRACEGLTK